MPVRRGQLFGGQRGSEPLDSSSHTSHDLLWYSTPRRVRRVPRLEVGLEAHQLLHRPLLAAVGCPVQRGHAIALGSADFSPRPQQGPHLFDVAAHGGIGDGGISRNSGTQDSQAQQGS